MAVLTLFAVVKETHALLTVLACTSLLIAACQPQPRGKYVSHVHLPTGMEMTEEVEFRANGICYFGQAPDHVVECKWKRDGDIISISRNDVVLSKLKRDGANFVLVEGGAFNSPFTPEN